MQILPNCIHIYIFFTKYINFEHALCDQIYLTVQQYSVIISKLVLYVIIHNRVRYIANFNIRQLFWNHLTF